MLAVNDDPQALRYLVRSDTLQCRQKYAAIEIEPSIAADPTIVTGADGHAQHNSAAGRWSTDRPGRCRLRSETQADDYDRQRMTRGDDGRFKWRQ